MSLLRYATTAFCVAIAVATLCFAALQVVPGDPAMRIAEAKFGADGMSFRTADELREAAGLNEPVIRQYASWIARTLTGDFGISLVSGQAVLPLVAERLQLTLLVGLVGIAVTIIISVPLGVAAGLRPNGWLDHSVSALSTLLASAPAFLVAILLVSLFAVNLQWLPVAGLRSPQGIVLPALTLGFIHCPELSRVVRNSVARTGQSFFVTFARLKGRSWSRIALGHALRPALLPVVAYFGVLVTGVVEGFVVIETVFNLPGIGKLLVDALIARDLPVVLGAVTIIGLGIVAVHAMTELLANLVDPRTVDSQASTTS
ncbi:ABC transporter permease [Chelatococcus asaccharovorans]|uniref:ABC transporter permease n=2 Tax=Chelatococcus asaccharovorans TaxID=28210 RepID=UPI00224C779F|nr:ABC transporter permease [Chelatococcus asaccharovorans]CAH1657109.1 Peptide/nickel transport system permease protein [Chelatococcus asaccharovorans]CAH1684889.1 Peptide/nickel transport system permease protein [Chelatococcus asaccharovorans]